MLDAATYDECVVLILADNGPMIPVEDRSKFFDPFFSTKERGIGLGFLISRTIIEEHDGKLWLDENSEIGAKFVIELPLRSEEHTSELQSLMSISYAVFCWKNNRTPVTQAHRVCSRLL